MANDNVDVTLVATTNAAHLATDIEYASVPYGLPTLGRRPGRCGTRAVPPRRSDTRSLAAARPDSSGLSFRTDKDGLGTVEVRKHAFEIVDLWKVVDHDVGMRRIPFQEILVVRFGAIKAPAGLDLRHDRRVESPRLVELGYEGLRDVALLGIHRKDRGSVLRADIRSLTVELRRIVNHREKHLQDSPVRDYTWVEGDLHGLGVAGLSCAHALVLGRALFSTGVT